MDVKRILIDTSTILGYLRRRNKEDTILYNLYETYDEICVSSVTVFEVFYGCSPENLAMMTLLFEGFTILSFDAKVAKIASREYQKLRDQGQYVAVRELVVAATALARNLPLATLNRQPFELIPDIRIVF